MGGPLRQTCGARHQAVPGGGLPCDPSPSPVPHPCPALCFFSLCPPQKAGSYEFDPLDVTKTWPEDRFPLQPVGRMVLNRCARHACPLCFMRAAAALFGVVLLDSARLALANTRLAWLCEAAAAAPMARLHPTVASSLRLAPPAPSLLPPHPLQQPRQLFQRERAAGLLPRAGGAGCARGRGTAGWWRWSGAHSARQLQHQQAAAGGWSKCARAAGGSALALAVQGTGLTA